MIKKSLNVLICDSSIIFSYGLAALLKNENKVSSVFTVNNSNELVKMVEQKTIQIIVIEDEFIGGNKSILITKIKKISPLSQIIVSSNLNETSLIEHYILKGAKGFIPKQSDDKIILDTIIKVASGSCVSNIESAQTLKALSCKRALEIGTKEFDLSKKEQEIMFMITEGKSNKAIADEMKITERTVEFHKTNIYKKTNSKSVADLVMLTIVSRLL